MISSLFTLFLLFTTPLVSGNEVAAEVCRDMTASGWSPGIVVSGAGWDDRLPD